MKWLLVMVFLSTSGELSTYTRLHDDYNDCRDNYLKSVFIIELFNDDKEVVYGNCQVVNVESIK